MSTPVARPIETLMHEMMDKARLLVDAAHAERNEDAYMLGATVFANILNWLGQRDMLPAANAGE